MNRLRDWLATILGCQRVRLDHSQRERHDPPTCERCWTVLDAEADASTR